ncbi:MAG: threonine synthase, partial [Candidatus Eisenbacteria bacterium]|nr:threonine synthase [Candidatus Eisenbacteria bacterium]
MKDFSTTKGAQAKTPSHSGRESSQNHDICTAGKQRALIDRYAEYLSVNDDTPRISLREGNTPLIPAPRLSRRVGARVFLKYEGANPTGSFKDRGMTVAVSKAVEAGAKTVICASTGNTAASAAAYAARAGLTCAVLVPQGKIALGKMAQALLMGARLIEVEGNFDDAMAAVLDLCERYPVTLVNSLNPYRIEGQMSGAFEIVDELGDAPIYHALPVGNAGNITAYWKGYKIYRRVGKSGRLPKMLGFQAAGAAPIVKGSPISHPETVATAIRVGNPASWQGAVAAANESGGLIEAISDQAILRAYHLVAKEEGVFCEPSSAAGVAGILKLSAAKMFKPDDVIVCVLTGNGLKDPQ